VLSEPDIVPVTRNRVRRDQRGVGAVRGPEKLRPRLAEIPSQEADTEKEVLIGLGGVGHRRRERPVPFITVRRVQVDRGQLPLTRLGTSEQNPDGRGEIMAEGPDSEVRMRNHRLSTGSTERSCPSPDFSGARCAECGDETAIPAFSRSSTTHLDLHLVRIQR